MIKTYSPTKKMIKYFYNNFIALPTPINITYLWNFGFLLGMSFMIQFISGLLLSMHYCPNTYYAFKSMIHIIQNVNHGWLVHNIHLNGASLFFILMYLHMGRGLYYMSYKLTLTWIAGMSIFIISMATAFLGYVLPWGQMSFWGATVITNLVSSIPYIGIKITLWIWGGFSINNATLNRFFSIHFLMPFMLMMLIMLHIFFLHETGSNNPLGVESNMFKVPFHNYFTFKDMLSLMIIMMFFNLMILQYPYMLSDPDNFVPTNPLNTPIHIQPEWYFLFAYAILRSIPNKTGGVIALIMSITIPYFMPMFKSMKFSSLMFYPINQILFWMFTNSFLMLTFLGGQPIEPPFIILSQIISMIYFMYFLLLLPLLKFWDMIIFN